MIKFFTPLFLLISAFAVAQPSNNNCGNAILLTYTNSCNFSTYTNTNATNSGNATSSCGSPTTDVWFKFVVPSSGVVAIQTNYINFRGAMALYTGSCTSLTQYMCDGNSGADYEMPYLFFEDFSKAGDTLYLQYFGDNGTSGDFQICVFEPTQPANKDCSGAIGINVQTACNYQYFTSAYGGNSGVGSPPCGQYLVNDVWFKVKVPQSGNLILKTVNNGISNPAMALYKGTCGNLQYFDCNDNGSEDYLQARFYIRDTSLAGDSLYIRVWRVNNIYGGAFGLCAFEPQIGLNENCEKAIYVQAKQDCDYTQFTNRYYNNSGSKTPSCGAYVGADAWFKTVIPASGKLVIRGRDVNIGNLVFSSFVGTCDSLQEYMCNDNGSRNYLQPEIIINDSSIAGDTLFIMAWRNNSVFGGEFEMCIFEPFIPEYLSCKTAKELVVKPSCNYQRFTNEFAGTSGDGAPNCGIYLGTDVWFKFLVPNSGEFTIDSRQAGLNNIDFALYTGTCGALTIYDCDANSSASSINMPKIEVSDTTLAGQTVFLQVWNYNDINGGSFDLCVFGKLIPEVKDPQSKTICEGEDIPALSVKPGVFQYNWYDQISGGNLLASDTHLYVPNGTGDFYVSATNTETNETSARTKISLEIIANPKIVNLKDQIICDNDMLMPLSVSDLQAVYTWYKDSMKNAILAEDTNRYLASTEGVYYVQALDESFGCTSELESVQLIIYAIPEIVNALDQEVCKDKLPILLSVTDEGANYRWYDTINGNLLAINKSSYSASKAGVFYIQAQDTITGCLSKWSEIVLEVNENPLVINGQGFESCTGQGYNGLSVEDQGKIYNWYDQAIGGILIANDRAVFNATQNATYYVEAVDPNSACFSTTRLAVTRLIYETKQALIAYDGDSLHTSDALSYQWFKNGIAIFNATGKSFDVVENGMYHVEVFDFNNCFSSSDTVQVDVVLGIVEHELNKVSAYPNPVHNRLNIKLDQAYLGSHIVLFNQFGQLLQSKEVDGLQMILDLAPYTKGIYYLKVKGDHLSQTIKLVKN